MSQNLKWGCKVEPMGGGVWAVVHGDNYLTSEKGVGHYWTKEPYTYYTAEIATERLASCPTPPPGAEPWRGQLVVQKIKNTDTFAALSPDEKCFWIPEDARWVDHNIKVDWLIGRYHPTESAARAAPDKPWPGYVAIPGTLEDWCSRCIVEQTKDGRWDVYAPCRKRFLSSFIHWMKTGPSQEFPKPTGIFNSEPAARSALSKSEPWPRYEAKGCECTTGTGCQPCVINHDRDEVVRTCSCPHCVEFWKQRAARVIEPDDWHALCKLVTYPDGTADISSPAGTHYWSPLLEQWMRMCSAAAGGSFGTQVEALAELPWIPTPYPGWDGQADKDGPGILGAIVELRKARDEAKALVADLRERLNGLAVNFKDLSVNYAELSKERDRLREALDSLSWIADGEGADEAKAVGELTKAAAAYAMAHENIAAADNNDHDGGRTETGRLAIVRLSFARGAMEVARVGLAMAALRLGAARVSKPATLHQRSPAASTNEMATAIEGAES